MESLIKDGFVDFDINITKFMYARRKEHDSAWVYETKNRSFSGIVLFYKGTLEYKDEYSSLEILPNTVLWLPKGHSYTFRAKGNGDVGFIALTFLTDGGGLPFRSIRLPQNNKDVAVMFDEALKIWLARDVGYNLALKNKTYLILSTVIRLYADDQTRQASNYEGLSKTVAYIHENTDKKISLAELSKLSGYSESYYRRLFHREYGMSPISYINLKRVEKAQKLLLGGSHTKREIAELCGFENQQFFARVFKKYTKKTPGEFAKTFEPESECEI